MRYHAILFALALSITSEVALAQDTDPYLWLEGIDDAKALAWVKQQNAISQTELAAVPEYQPIFDKSLEIFDSEERIPMPSLRGDQVDNFWQDHAHERGIWRRTTLASYRTPDPAWNTLLDLDALSKADGQPWVFKGADCLPPEHRLCLVALSRGGGDAIVVREFETVAKAFVTGGFSLPEAKSQVAWRDKDTLWVGTDFGPGSLTSSGYPREVKLWRRGTPLSEARTVFEGQAEDVASSGNSIFTAEGRYDVVSRAVTFYTAETYLMLGERLVRIPIPDDASFQGVFRDQVLFSLRSDWTVGGASYKQGSLLASGLDDLLRGKHALSVLFEPSERTSLDGVATTRDAVLVGSLDNVHGKLVRWAFAAGAWTREDVPLPGLGTAGIAAASDDSRAYFLLYQDFLTPSSLLLAEGAQAQQVKSLPAFFDPAGMKVDQLEATSPDGTKVPYFVVSPPGFQANGSAPTLLYGYGGFEVAEVPSYSGVRGTAWLKRGGVFVLANIRGGGEFGPRWHRAALRQDRVKAFQDFAAVAEDLVARKITASPHLGIMGGSNGGLLVGATFTRRPDLFGAVVCQVPLLDMRRYSKLLAGASWMAEYGDPDKPEDWAHIQTWSPYHNLKKDTRYPKVFFWTTTRDDRVHPGHARKMVAKMLDLGHPVYYFENIEGGHGSGAVNRQRALTTALEYAYLWKMLR